MLKSRIKLALFCREYPKKLFCGKIRAILYIRTAMPVKGRQLLRKS